MEAWFHSLLCISDVATREHFPLLGLFKTTQQVPAPVFRKASSIFHTVDKIWPEPLNTFLNGHVPQPSGNAPEGQGAALTFSLDSGETKESKPRSFLNERLSCLIHLELYKTRAAIIYAYRDIYLFLIVSCFKI